MSIYVAAFHAARILEECGVPYFLAGSFSSIYYSFSRPTIDADFVVQFENQSIFQVLKRLGPGYIIDPQITFKTLTMSTRYCVAVADSPFKLEFFRLTDDPFDCSRFARRIRVELEGILLWLPTVEDVIVMKLRWSRDKDRIDIRNVIAVQGIPNLDWDYLNHWCRLHKSLDVLNEIVRTISPDNA